MIRVILPGHLNTLAGTRGEILVDAGERPTIGSVLGAIEKRYPMLKGTMRDQNTHVRRPFVRFFLCQEDWSHEPADLPLPAEVASGAELFLVVGAVAGGALAPAAVNSCPEAQR